MTSMGMETGLPKKPNLAAKQVHERTCAGGNFSISEQQVNAVPFGWFPARRSRTTGTQVTRPNGVLAHGC